MPSSNGLIVRGGICIGDLTAVVSKPDCGLNKHRFAYSTYQIDRRNHSEFFQAYVIFGNGGGHGLRVSDVIESGLLKLVLERTVWGLFMK